MKNAYKRRPGDFKRRILAYITTSRNDMFDEEYKWLSMIRDSEIGTKYYNLIKHHSSHWSINEESRVNMVNFLKCRTPHNKGKHLSAKHKANISAANTGKHHSEETRSKLSIIRKGRTAPNKGVPCSIEQKAKISAANKGRIHSEETKAKISATLRSKISSRRTTL